MSDHLDRLHSFLSSRDQGSEAVSLTADASTREYFRITWNGVSAVACVYPERFDPAEQTYLDVTRLFTAGNLPVARILDFDGELGIIVQEDLGDLILRDMLIEADQTTRSAKIDQAIALIARIQATTELAYQMGSVASTLAFDADKLRWELDYFATHYFDTYLKKPLSSDESNALASEFDELAAELGSFAEVLCHRDFHAANLMLDGQGQLRIIDHQDARIGSVMYDLVSLLLDRVTKLPSRTWLAERRAVLSGERRKLGLSGLEGPGRDQEFELQTIQRCLKAVGTFSFQSATRGKTYFVPYIEPMFRIVLRAIDDLGRFPETKRVLERCVDA